MVDLAVLQSLSYVAAAIGVLLAAINYIISTRNDVKARQASLLMGIYKDMTSDEMPKRSYELLGWTWTDFRLPEKIRGVLLRKGLIDRMFIYDLLSSPLFLYWERMGPVILERRRVTNNQNLFGFVDYLYDEMKKIEAEQAATKT